MYGLKKGQIGLAKLGLGSYNKPSKPGVFAASISYPQDLQRSNVFRTCLIVFDLQLFYHDHAKGMSQVDGMEP